MLRVKTVYNSGSLWQEPIGYWLIHFATFQWVLILTYLLHSLKKTLLQIIIVHSPNLNYPAPLPCNGHCNCTLGHCNYIDKIPSISGQHLIDFLSTYICKHGSQANE